MRMSHRRGLFAGRKAKEFLYHGTVAAGSTYSGTLGMTNVGDYLILSAANSSGNTLRPRSINSSLVVSTLSNGNTNGNQGSLDLPSYGVLFGGTYDYWSDSGWWEGDSANAINAFNSSLVVTIKTLPAASSFAHQRKRQVIGNYGVIPLSTSVATITDSLIVSTAAALTANRNGSPSALSDSMAIFFGGHSQSITTSTSEGYNASLVRSDGPVLSVNVGAHNAVRFGQYILSAGGWTTAAISVCDVFDATSLVRTTGTSLSAARYNLGAAADSNFAVFAGGSSNSSVVDIYNKALVRTTATALPWGGNASAGTIDKYFAMAGYNSNTAIYKVE